MNFGSTASARAMPMRCLRPPVQLVRIGVFKAPRKANGIHELLNALGKVRAGGAKLAYADGLSNNIPHGHARIQGRKRVLKDDLHFAPKVHELLFAERSDIGAVVKDLALVGSMSRKMVRPSVDFPQPLSPTTPSVVPPAIARSTPSTAWSIPFGVLKYFF